MNIQSDLDDQKKELEIEKLKTEVEQAIANLKEIKKSWYQKPQWISALSPIFVGILTLIIIRASGVLQAQATLNKIQEENYLKRKDTIEGKIKNYSLILDSVKLILDSTTKGKDSILQYNEILKKQNEELHNISDSVKTKFTTNSTKTNYLIQKFLAENSKVNSYQKQLISYKAKIEELSISYDSIIVRYYEQSRINEDYLKFLENLRKENEILRAKLSSIN